MIKFFEVEFEPYQLVILIVFVISLLIQLGYYLGIYSRIVFYKKKYQPTIAYEPVSIVICARDEAVNLKQFLPSILDQRYPDYEVIVVNDCSHDNTEEVLELFKQDYPHLRSTIIKEDEKFFHGKKIALMIGIKAAKNDLLLLTDADCKASHYDWLMNMQQNFVEKTEVTLGYGGFFKEKGFLDKLIRYDGMFVALQYLSFALVGMPYMGVGRNLSYRKSLFFKNKGFASHHHLFSGDDDLFVNEVANKNNTKVEIDPKSYTRTLQKTSFMDWFWQKGRHLTTSKKYQFKHKVMLMLEPLSRMLFYSLFASLIVLGIFPIFVVSAFFIRLLIQLSIIKLTMKRLHEEDLLLSSLLFDVALPFIYIALGLTNLFIPKPRKWK